VGQQPKIGGSHLSVSDIGDHADVIAHARRLSGI
jgi:hypothetical protein